MQFNANRNKGFTLVELMITLVIVAILMALAVPSFNSTIKNNRISTQASELITSLNYVRSEAIKRGADVTIGRADVNWENGWVITNRENSTGRIITISVTGRASVSETACNVS